MRDFFYLFKDEYWMEEKEKKKQPKLLDEIEDIFGSLPIKFVTSKRLTEEVIKILEKRLDCFIKEHEGHDILKDLKKEMLK